MGPIKVLLVGEAPGKGGIPGEDALRGRIGRRLASLMGLTVSEYETRVDRINVLPYWPGKAPGNGAAWPAREAAQAARRLALVWTGGPLVIVLLGRRVARAFGVASDASWFWPVWSAVLARKVWLAPHPSGANRWWNEESNRRQAAAFWKGWDLGEKGRGLVGRAREDRTRGQVGQ